MTRFSSRPVGQNPIPLWSGATPLMHDGDTSNQPTLTPFFASERDVTSAIVVLPGGGYAMRATHEGRPVAEWLNTLGISAFVADYRVAPYQHPVPLMDAQRSIRYVRYHASEWGIHPDQIGILGFSAGGHLASTAATHFDDGIVASPDPVNAVSSRPDLAILCYPVISMLNYAHLGSKQNLLGDNPSPELVESLSNELRVTELTPPTFLWHTADDESVPVENSLLFAGALSRHGVPFDLHVYEHGSHGLGLAEDDPHVGLWTASCAQWLRARGFR